MPPLPPRWLRPCFTCIFECLQLIRIQLHLTRKYEFRVCSVVWTIELYKGAIVRGAKNTGACVIPEISGASQFILIELTLNQNKLLLTRISRYDFISTKIFILKIVQLLLKRSTFKNTVHLHSQCWEGTRVLVLEYCTRVLFMSTRNEYFFVKVLGTRVPTSIFKNYT